MALDDSIQRVLADRTASKCKTCQMVRDGKVTDEKIQAVVEPYGFPVMAAALKLEYGDAPSSDAIRRHVQNHVAG